MKTYKTESSNIKRIGYNIKEKKLIVTFNSNVSYYYVNVPPETVCDLLFSESTGEIFHHKIKKHYDAKRVE